MPTALVLDLATCRATNRFTLCDRMELDRWSGIAQARGTRLELHERVDGDPSDVGNYAAVYVAGCCWASWGLSRRAGGIVVWDSATGRDSGCFATVHEALCRLLDRRPDPACDAAGRRDDAPRKDGRRARFAGRMVLVEGVGFEPT